MEVNRCRLLGLLLVSGLFVSYSANAGLPSQVTFSNETSLSLATSIAGLPGYGIEPSVSKSVSFSMVNMGCNYSGSPENCPINFTDKATGQMVATVYINALTGALNSEPQFYGEYASSYTVTGWEDIPINHITIVKKGGGIWL